MKHIILFFFFTIFSLCVFSQTDSLDVKRMTRNQMQKLSNEQLLSLNMTDLIFIADHLGVSVEELMNRKTTVSTKTDMTSRETPSIVTTISDEEIEQSGARNLSEILQAVPGFNFGYDIDGILGLSVRGNWGQEGKILLLVDGQECNDGLYSAVPYGNQLSAEMIESVEIIRGPGSALYGGYAELAVIKVTTKTALNNDLTQIYLKGASAVSKISETSAGFNIARKRKDFSIDTKVYWSADKRSFENLYFFPEDTLYDLSEKYGDRQSLTANLGASYKDFGLRLIYDDFLPQTAGYELAALNRFTSFYSELNYGAHLSEHTTITPSLGFKSQSPYNLKTELWTYDRTFQEYQASVDFISKPLDYLDISGGITGELERAFDNDTSLFYNNKKQVDFSLFSAYLQGSVKTKFVNFFAGARYDYHSYATNNITPRFALTKAFNRLHFKLLHSYAFRLPSVENFNLSQTIEPEKSQISEFEAGLKITDNIFISANVFNIVIKKPIVYSWNPELQEETYFNEEQTGTRGIETQLLLKFPVWTVNTSYSYYTAKDINKIDVYAVYYPEEQENKHALKGNPQHQFNFTGTFFFKRNMFLTAKYLLSGNNYGYITGLEKQEMQKPVHLIEIFFTIRKLNLSPLGFSVGVKNILDKSFYYIQPSGTADMVETAYPAQRREILFKIDFKF